MKRMASLVAATAALGLVAAVHANSPEEQALVEQAAPAAQPADPSTAAGPSGATTSAPSAEQNVRLAAVMPPGMTTEEACAGFRGVGECAATLHASHNLSIPFADLKAKVTNGQTLGAAIHDLKPDANATAEASKAEEQGHRDLHAPSG